MNGLGTDYFGFPNQSEHYDNSRPAYPQKIVDQIIDVCRHKAADWGKESRPLSQKGSGKKLMDKCAIDIACGTGLFTRMIAPYFGRVIGLDISRKQLETARLVNESSAAFGNVMYMNYDAYDLEAMLKECKVSPSDVCLVTVAEAIHWLDIPRLLDILTKLFSRGFVFAPVAYLFPPEVMNNQIMISKLPNLLNPEVVHQSYVEELQLCDQHVKDFHAVMAEYTMCDHSWMKTHFKDQNFEKYFSDNKFIEMCVLKNSNLYNLKHLMMSISSYNVFGNKNQEKLRSGAIKDPLELMVQNILNAIGNQPLKEKSQTNIDSQLRSTEFQFLWRFFVHILSS